ncbi:MAG TPA: biotin carboxylase, partial [Ohtaekwangia sp.]|nr:biotin carboxylase [Ohtaekwangia sp.]
RFVMTHEAFRSGDFNTRFVENHFKPDLLKSPYVAEEAMLAAALASTLSAPEKNSENGMPQHQSRWKKNRIL